MTIPRLPGWWDENKEAFQSMAQTLMRATNPNFDNQLALLSNIRENPANAQIAVDQAFLNPEMFNQLYGPRMMDYLANMGTASSAAQTEQEARNLMKANQPLTEVAPNVRTRAAAQKLQVPIGAEARTEEARATVLETQATRDAYNFLREKDINALTDPVLRRRAQTILDTLTEFPELENIDVSKMARDFIIEGPTPEFNRMYEGLIARAPNAAKLFDTTLDFLRLTMRDENIQERENQRMQRQYERDDQQYFREIMRDARKLTQEVPGISVDDAFLLFTKGEDAISARARLLLQQREDVRQRGARQQAFGRIVDDFREASKIRNKDEREFNLNTAAASLSALTTLNIQVQKVKIDGSFFDKENKFLLNGTIPITGNEIMELINYPERAKFIERKAQVGAMEPEEVMAELKTLEDSIAANPTLAGDAEIAAERTLLRQRVAELEREGSRQRGGVSDRIPTRTPR